MNFNQFEALGQEITIRQNKVRMLFYWVDVTMHELFQVFTYSCTPDSIGIIHCISGKYHLFLTKDTKGNKGFFSAKSLPEHWESVSSDIIEVNVNEILESIKKVENYILNFRENEIYKVDELINLVTK